MMRFTGYRVIAEKPRVKAEFFRAPFMKKNYALDRKMISTFLMVSTSSITMQSLGKIEQRAPAGSTKMWCLYVSFCLFYGTVRRRAVHSSGHILSSYFVAVYWSILIVFIVFRQ